MCMHVCPLYRFSCEATVEHHIKSTISSTDKQLPRFADLLENTKRVKKDIQGNGLGNSKCELYTLQKINPSVSR